MKVYDVSHYSNSPFEKRKKKLETTHESCPLINGIPTVLLIDPCENCASFCHKNGRNWHFSGFSFMVSDNWHFSGFSFMVSDNWHFSGMMVKVVTKFHKCHLGAGVCLNVCVQGFIQDFEFWEGGGGNSKVLLMWRGCRAHN